MSNLPVTTEESWIDQYGTIEADVYEQAQKLWPHLEAFSHQILADPHEGQQLLMKACALVTRVRTQEPHRISNLSAYLKTTWKHLVLAEAEKAKRHDRSNSLIAQESREPDLTSAIEREILLREIVAQMDPWTREVFENLVLGYTFEEMSPAFKQSGHVLRTKYSKRLRKLIARIKAESGT